MNNINISGANRAISTLWRVNASATAVTGITQISGSLQTPVDVTAILNIIYPIGSYYISGDATNPSQRFGFGQWERCRGRVLVGVDEEDTDFSEAGLTGGAKTHTLTTAQMPSHTHTQNAHHHSVDPPSTTTSSNGAHTHGLSQGLGGGGAVIANHLASGNGAPHNASGSNLRPTNVTVNNGGAHTHTLNIAAFNSANTTAVNQNTGGGGAHNNLQPYITAYIWRRIA